MLVVRMPPDPVIRFFHSLWGHATLDRLMALSADFAIAVPALALLFGLVRKRPAWPTMLAAFAAPIVAFGASYVAGLLYYSERPFVVLGVTPLIAHVRDNGFPSDHSAIAAAIATMLFFIDVRAAWVAVAGTLLLGLARVYCLVHWPGDVLGAWLIGAAVGVAAGLVRMPRRRVQHGFRSAP